MKPEDFIQMPIPASMFTAVCALLGGTNTTQPVAVGKVEFVKQATAPASDTSETDVQESPVSDGTGPTATNTASPSDPNDVDAHGHAWSADLHASTKGKTKEGLWRMKPGAVRPDPKPGFPIEDTSTSTENTGETESTPSEAAPIVDAAPAEPTEDDEFAAFRAADAKLAEQDAAAVASIPARKFTDADLSAVCNQAAVKLGDPAPVKALIAEFVPEGEIQHSRMIPDAKRADFVAAVEAKAGIEFAG
jgi:hypothetical protein